MREDSLFLMKHRGIYFWKLSWIVAICLLVIAFAGSKIKAKEISATSTAQFHSDQFNKNAMNSFPYESLSLEEREVCQRKVEEVLWKHRIWPESNKEPKPSFDSMISREQMIARAKDAVQKSQALEYFWQRPLTSKQIQMEMNRMAKHTKQPEVLREIWSALDNDPFMIAECLVRPVLADRLVRNWYAHDARFHGELKERIEKEILSFTVPEQMKYSSGKYNEIEIKKSDDDLIDRMRVGEISGLKEDMERFYLLTVLERRPGKVKIASVEWMKVSFEEWWQKVSEMMPLDGIETKGHYVLPKLDDACVVDTWNDIAGPPQQRQYHTAVWTGTEMIIWGGDEYNGQVNTGAKYNPSTDTWVLVTKTGAPEPRAYHTAVWTGTEMIVWGGARNSNSLNSGGRYNPTSNTWIATSTVNAPAAGGHAAVWADPEMIIWGGDSTNTGGKYNPSTNTWTATSTVGAPTGRSGPTAVWTGTEMIVWGGYSTNTGGKYYPSLDTWVATSTVNAPAARTIHTAVWTGTEMIIWGGQNGSWYNTGGKYIPSADTWTATSTVNAPTARCGHTAVWTDSEMIVWGGKNATATGGRYAPGTDTWTVVATTNAPEYRYYHTAVWTGTEMIIWGGYGGKRLNTGGRFNPTLNSWVASGINEVTRRYDESAVWTGTEMIIWGGEYLAVPVNTGARYLPSLDTWIRTNTTGAPSARYAHSAVWSGTRMVVWGGRDSPSTNTGGLYNPAADSWTATSTVGAPTARYRHTAVWTGSGMIVWGGDPFENTGGIYYPSGNDWITLSTTDAPQGRYGHTAIWSGTDMIIWGGYGGTTFLNTGARYNLQSGRWTALSTVNAPSPRQNHSAIWTGTAMIIWGGSDNNDRYNDGGKYNPLSDIWIQTSTVNAPTVRSSHSAVWTGTEMIIWGGYNNGRYNDGGKYNPISNTWIPTSTVNAPTVRSSHSAVWTGTEMIIWGGGGSDDSLNSGARYCVCNNISAPSNVTATATAPNQITVTWTPVTGASGYNVYRRHPYCGTSIELKIAENITTVSFVDNNVFGSLNYQYSITALAQCETAKSSWASVTATGTCYQAPCFFGITSVVNNENDPCRLELSWNNLSSNCPEYPDATVSIYRSTNPVFQPSPSNLIATCYQGSYYWDYTAAFGTTYYYIARAEDSRSGGGAGLCNGGNTDTNLIIKGGSPSGGIYTYFSGDFGSGSSGWNWYNWHLDAYQYHSPYYSAKHDATDNAVCDTLTMDSYVDLPPIGAPVLRFWTRFGIESGYDAGIVEISTNSVSWNKLPLTPDYPGTTVEGAQLCLGTHPQPAFTGTDLTWKEYTSDLSSYVGNSIKLRFNYASNSTNSLEGWWIDDVTIKDIQSCTALSLLPGRVANTLKAYKASGGNVSLQWTAPGGSCSVNSYDMYRGALPWSGYNHSIITCSCTSTNYYDSQASAGSYYYLVVPRNDSYEGSYGLDSASQERPAAAVPCRQQSLTPC